MKHIKLFILVVIVALIQSCSDPECNPIIDSNCQTTQEYNPVCGCNDVTYFNGSNARCNNIHEFTAGKCKSNHNLEGKWQFLGYESEGAMINNTTKTHDYDMYIDFTTDKLGTDAAGIDSLGIDGKSSINFLGGSFKLLNQDGIDFNVALQTKIGGSNEALLYESDFILFINGGYKYLVNKEYLSIQSIVIVRDPSNFQNVQTLIFKKI